MTPNTASSEMPPPWLAVRAATARTARSAEPGLERPGDVALRRGVDTHVLRELGEGLPVAGDGVGPVEAPVLPVLQHARRAVRCRRRGTSSHQDGDDDRQQSKEERDSVLGQREPPLPSS